MINRINDNTFNCKLTVMYEGEPDSQEIRLEINEEYDKSYADLSFESLAHLRAFAKMLLEWEPDPVKVSVEPTGEISRGSSEHDLILEVENAEQDIPLEVSFMLPERVLTTTALIEEIAKDYVRRYYPDVEEGDSEDNNCEESGHE